MSRRSTSKTTTVITSSSTVQPRNDVVIDVSLLGDDEFDKRPKTDYTYSRSATYSSKYVDGQVVSPNLSRRRLYTTQELIREKQASSNLMKMNTNNANSTSHVRIYGRTRNSLNANQIGGSTGDSDINTRVSNGLSSVNLNRMNEQRSATNQSTTEHTVYTTRSNRSQRSTLQADKMSTMQQQNNNNSEAIFSDDEQDSVMARSASRRQGSKRATSRSRSPGRKARGGGSSRRRSARLVNDADSDSSADIRAGVGGVAGTRKSTSYALSSGLDNESDSLQRITHKNTKYNAQELVTERSSTVIDTVATGTPLAAKLMGCILFVYGCTRILINRIWFNFGRPVYATLQRYLLLDSWLLSSSFARSLRALILAPLFLLLLLALLAGGTCSLHALGFVNVAPCAPLTGIYYVNKHSDVNTPGMTVKLRAMLDDLLKWSETNGSPSQPAANSGKPAVDWDSIIEARINILKTTLERQSNTEISMQRQKNTELETTLLALTRDVDDIKRRMDSLNSLVTELAELKIQVAQLSQLVESKPDYREAISKLQVDIRNLQIKLGDVNLGEAEGAEAGILTYLHNEINNLKTVINKQERVAMTPPVCPESGCVCESDLGLRLRSLHDDLMRELNEKSGGGATTVFVSSENSTGISEQLVKKMIKEELDIFAADKTGMPDFALQSMGAQVVSTRCSQTYYQDTGIMTYFGLPLYHLHKDPSVVIQPGVTPGECWCFHGQSGSLVIELAESVKFNSFSLEHISASQSVTGEILSAPKDLEIYGLTSELDTEGHKIGEWQYDKTGPRLQFFPVKDPTISGYPVVELRILSNWGKKDFTCLYRFRVHGKLAPK